jgi:riboflavin biosynthesis pyrimidine reductase
MSQTSKDVDLGEFYVWPDKWWVRAMMVQSLDGAHAGPDGKSRSISSERDREVLQETRRLSDVVLVGAETIRAERYRPMVAKAQWQDARANAGLTPAPVVAIVSASLDLPWEEPLFGESEFTPLVFTGGTASVERTAIAQEMVTAGKVEIIVCSDLPVGALDVLRERGLTRIVCEGGPNLLATLNPHVDELDLTIAPMLVGRQVPSPIDSESESQSAVGELIDWKLSGFWEYEGFVFTRYVRA